MQYNITLYYTILCYSTLYCTMICYTIRYYTVLCYWVPVSVVRHVDLIMPSRYYLQAWVLCLCMRPGDT